VKTIFEMADATGTFSEPLAAWRTERGLGELLPLRLRSAIRPTAIEMLRCNIDVHGQSTESPPPVRFASR
jgi:hypothetical protein